MAYYDDLTYKRDEIKKFLNDKVKELKEYSKDEYNTLVKDQNISKTQLTRQALSDYIKNQN